MTDIHLDEPLHQQSLEVLFSVSIGTRILLSITRIYPQAMSYLDASLEDVSESDRNAILNSITPFAAWGTSASLNIQKHSQSKGISQPNIQHIHEKEFLYIVGSRIAVINCVDAPSIKSSYSSYATTLLPTSPHIESYLSLHVSYPNEKYLVCPIHLATSNEPRGFQESNSVAGLAIYDFSSSSRTDSSLYPVYTNLVPRIVRYRSPNSSSPSTLPKSRGEDKTESYQFTCVSFAHDGSLFLSSTNNIHDGILVFNTVAVIASSIAHAQSPNASMFSAPLYQIPTTTLVMSASFHPQDSSKFFVTGDKGLISFWRYAGSSVRPSPISGSARAAADLHHPFTCHAWLGENLLVAGSTNNTIYLIQVPSSCLSISSIVTHSDYSIGLRGGQGNSRCLRKDACSSNCFKNLNSRWFLDLLFVRVGSLSFIRNQAIRVIVSTRFISEVDLLHSLPVA
jgi:hypothetical protein